MSDENAWTDSLERDIEISEGQIALADLLPTHTTRFIHIELERLKRLLEAAKSTLDDNE